MSYTLNIPAAHRVSINKAIRALKLKGGIGEAVFIDPANGALTITSHTNLSQVRISSPANVSETDLGVWTLERSLFPKKDMWIDASSFTLDTEAETLTIITKGITRTYHVELAEEVRMDAHGYTRVPGETLASFEVNNSNRAAFKTVTVATGDGKDVALLADCMVYLGAGETSAAFMGTDRHRMSSIVVDTISEATDSSHTSVPRIALELAGSKWATRMDMHKVGRDSDNTGSATVTLEHVDGSLGITFTRTHYSLPPRMRTFIHDMPANERAQCKVTIEHPKDFAEAVGRLHTAAGKPKRGTPVVLTVDSSGAQLTLESENQDKPLLHILSGVTIAPGVSFRAGFNPELLKSLLSTGGDTPLVFKSASERHPWYLTGFEDKHIECLLIMPIRLGDKAPVNA